MKINTFKGNCKISVWLCQIAKNLWYNEVKKNKKIQQVEEENLLALASKYIEKLTEEETNKYIENHLKECSTVLEKMQKELMLDKEKELYKEETNYLKKYNKKLNGLRIIISIVILICIFMLVRKMIILMNIQKTAEKYINSNNYYIKSCWYEGEQMRTSETYVKGEQYKKH